ncbi:hypothetical protein Hypma_002034 [Hypsizygus marmoreus]|uniref:Integrase zinc-binding domain-containing protein n=1 Tax=Hypsizygus marmoreus TaxID=39966 RepID=A0A369J4T6_HYPMA|nr:hypothetical protein Hypma_002034 [Hypsizygus marmoreus]
MFLLHNFMDQMPCRVIQSQMEKRLREMMTHKAHSPSISCLSSTLATAKFIHLVDIWHFLETLELPEAESLQAQKRFLKSTTDFFLKDIEGKQLMFKHNPNRIPALVVLDKKRRVAIMTMSHNNLGHKGEQAVYELFKICFY